MINASGKAPYEARENVAPDWASRQTEILCPLCGYNLRGLTESRCPECGFKFTWEELLEAEKDRQLYLFEYGKGRNLETFWKTYWRTCRPRRFWREINPAHEVRWIRLIIFWILSSSIVASFAAVPYVKPAWRVASQNVSMRARYKPVPGMPNYFSYGTSANTWNSMLNAQQLDYAFPLPWHLKFWREAEEQESGSYYYSNGNFVSSSSDVPQAVAWCVTFLAWPILTLITLMIFRLSMRQAKIRTSHLVRAVVYSCDFGLLITIAAIAGSFLNGRLSQGSNMIAFATICAFITTYRLTIAFREYIRAHMPLATVLASQIIAVLITAVALVPIADFSRRL